MAAVDKSVTAVIIDDDALVRQLLGTILRASGIEVVGEADDGDQVLDVVARTNPDVVLMDLRMSRISGIDATRALRRRSERPGILAMTSFDTEAAILDAVSAGVNGFIAKDAPPDEIVQAARLVAQGEGSLSPRATRFVLNQVNQGGAASSKPGPSPVLDSLTDRELEVALLVGKGYTNQEIADQLMVSLATVKTHLSSVMTRLGTTNRTQAALMVDRALRGESSLK